MNSENEATMSLRNELAESTLALCLIPSETQNEAEIAARIEARCLALAGKAAVTRIGNSIICEPRPRDARIELPTIALVGHVDTVRCAAGQPYEVRDGFVYGCGASDMKGGLAVMLALLERWRALEGARIVWIFYEGEEGPVELNGLEPVLNSGVLPPLDFAFILEPTDRALQPGCMGALHATVTVHGRRAHSARPWQGDNAIYRATALLQRFASCERRTVMVSGLPFYEVMVVTQAATANSRNVVPDRLTLNVNARFAPGRTAEDAEADVRRLVGDDGTVEIVDVAPSGSVESDHPLIREWRQREEIPILPKQAWTDVARLTTHGIPAVNFGPGETAQCHQENESCSIDSLEWCFRMLWDYLSGAAKPPPVTRSAPRS